MSISLDTFGQRVSWLLSKKHMKQKQLAAAMDISEQFMGALIHGRRKPNLEHLQSAAGALDTSVSFLALDGDDPMPMHSRQRVEPVYLSQAAEAARLIDTMPEPWRMMALDVVRVIADHAAGKDNS